MRTLLALVDAVADASAVSSPAPSPPPSSSSSSSASLLPSSSSSTYSIAFEIQVGTLNECGAVHTFAFHSLSVLSLAIIILVLLQHCSWVSFFKMEP
jgi:hypothetical protein